MRFILSTFMLLHCLYVSAGIKGKNLLPFHITHKYIDTSLHKNEALLKVQCYNPSGLLIKNFTIDMAVDGTPKGLDIDTAGNAVIKTTPGKHVFHFSTYYFEEVTTDTIIFKSRNVIEGVVYFKDDGQPRPMKKPVIYLYQTPGIVTLCITPQKLFFSYPAMNSAWDITADTSGIITSTGRTYPYLFWEGEGSFSADETNFKTGFIVKQDNLLSFLEEKTSEIGLNGREKQDFITFWYPQMRKADCVSVHFMFSEEYAPHAKLDIDKKPESILRVYMLWKKVKAPYTEIKPQEIPVFERKGFTLVEWGGTELDNALYH